MTGLPWCWCCAQWRLHEPGTQAGQGGGHLCASCAESSPAACRRRHTEQQALKAGAAGG